jgi:hypothetical protein
MSTKSGVLALRRLVPVITGRVESVTAIAEASFVAG